MKGWEVFKIAGAGEYLGCVVGPLRDAEACLVKPSGNFTSRSIELAAGGIATSIATDIFNFKIAPTMSYVGQLVAVAPCVIKLEKWAIQKILKVAHNALPRGAAHLIHQAGARKFTSVEITSAAAQVRARRGLGDVDDGAAELSAAQLARGRQPGVGVGASLRPAGGYGDLRRVHVDLAHELLSPTRGDS